MGVQTAPRQMAIFGVDIGCPVVTNGTLLCSCVKVHEAIELPFRVESGVILVFTFVVPAHPGSPGQIPEEQ